MSKSTSLFTVATYVVFFSISLASLAQVALVSGFVRDETTVDSGTFSSGTGTITFTSGSGSEGATAPVSIGTLTPGETVTLTATLSAQASLESQGVRLGIFNDSPNPEPNITNWLGYVAPMGAGPSSLYERNPGGGGNYYSTTGATEIFPFFTPTGTNANSPPAATYSLSLSLTRVGTGLSTDSLTSTYSLIKTSSSGAASYSFTGTNTDATVNTFTFDRVGIYENSTLNGGLKMTFSNINLTTTTIPEPTSAAAIGLASGLLLGSRRRK